MGTVDEFRQKGAIGALRDAALDARDMATDAGSWLVGNVRSLVDGDGNATAVLRYDGVPPRGATAPLQFSDGRVMQATVLQVDGVSQPPRAQVKVDGIDETVLVPVHPTSEAAEGAEGAADSADAGLLASIRQEFTHTVQDFREKGAVGALKDAARDAVDIVGSTAGKAVDLVGSTAGKAVDGAISLIDVEPKPEQAGQAGDQPAQQRGSVRQLVDGVKSEIHSTVQDFREKGAVATFKDAALDAVDLVGSTATTVVSGAKGVAAPLLEDFWANDKPEQPAAAPTSGSAPSTAATPAVAPVGASADSTPAASSTAPAPTAAASSSGGYAAPSPSSSPAPSGGYTPTKGPEAEGSEDKPAKKSLVEMRRNMFEKPKAEQKKEEEEEVID
ncbi:Ube3c [Symbiodinium natans]|uniref:Ube3c protein n=1 Tax=Symbiodinium natans TaxID=878477 RepID=A0A812T2S5_9DINO|nr:Ube3c [Symbiodinium natans]